MNFDLELQTTDGTLVCPFSAALDRREGHGLQAAMKTRTHVFNRQEDAEKAGCQEWRGNIFIQLSSDEKNQAKKWQADHTCGMLLFDEGFVHSCDLKNSPENKNRPLFGSEAQISPQEQSTEILASNNVGPSFACSKAKSIAEHLICNDEELSSMDRVLANIYVKAKSVAPDPASFQKTNLERWQERETQCSAKPCIKEWYEARQNELNDVIRKNSQSKSVTNAPVQSTYPWEGSFSNGTVTITRRIGNRGGDELVSTKCKSTVFKPMFEASNDSLFGETQSYAYMIIPDAKYSLLDITGSNPCMPEGRYLRVK